MSITAHNAQAIGFWLSETIDEVKTEIIFPNESECFTYHEPPLKGSPVSSQGSPPSVSDCVVLKKEYKELPKNVCPTTCLVCGDKATGYHYEVPSCNGCKTFFRRTVLGGTKFHCNKQGKCFDPLPKQNRSLCRACRFEQCVDVGMNPNVIALPQDEKPNELLKEILRKRRVAEDLNTPSTSSNKVIPQSLLAMECVLEKTIQSLDYLELKSDQFRKSRFNPNPYKLPPLEVLVEQGCAFYLADKLGPVHEWPNRLTYQPVKPHEFDEQSSFKHWLAFDLLTTVEYAKTFPFFHKLSLSDKTSLLKAVSLMCFGLSQAFFSYSSKSDRHLHPDGTTLPPADKLATRKVFEPLHRLKHKSIEVLIRNNLTRKEYLLIKAIILCNSSAPGLSEYGMKLVDEEKNRLSKTLCSYLLAQFGDAGPSRYAADLGIIDSMEYLSKLHKDVHVLVLMAQPKSMHIQFVDELFS